MSLSQYSYGKIAEFTRQEKDLTEYGGYDAEGNITKNASKIRNGGTHLPIGYWKGSALSIVLDLMAAILSGGKKTTEIGRKSTVDTNISQVFIAINPTKFGDSHFQQNLISETIEHFRVSSEENINEIRYPGKGVLERRKKNLVDGIKVEKEIWEKILIL
jgi:3-dehydro-L-gulonate 2-dehydrogenase